MSWSATAGWAGWSASWRRSTTARSPASIDPAVAVALGRDRRRPLGRRRRGDRFHLAGRGDVERAGAGRARHQRRDRHHRLAARTKPSCGRRSPTPGSASSRRRTSRPAWCCSRRSSRTRRGCSPAQAEFGAWLHEAHHAMKKDAPSGTALMLKRAMEEAGYARPIDVSSTRAGFIPGHAHDRLRRAVGIDYADAHGARSRRLRPRRADRGAVGAGPARLVHDAGRAGIRRSCS